MGKRHQRSNNRQAGQGNQVRIIGGAHRGRKLKFPSLPGLRPTADRVRETLFNWLQPLLPGADCLDLYAGSGALGLEAASRGAGRVVMLDRSAEVVNQLRENIGLLQLDQVEVWQTDALEWLAGSPSPGIRPFDLVFLDPPFADDLLEQSCRQLDSAGWLKSEARIYLEMDAGHQLPELPERWQLLRRKKAGQVWYHLFSCGN